MKVINQLKMEFPSLPENVSFARVAVASFASQLDFTIHDLEEIKVAVSEAVANAIVHGYGNAPGGLIRVCVKLSGEALEVQVEDQGRGIEDVKKALEPTYSSDPERMGLGFVFMQAFMDYLHVESAPGKGTRITMVKNVPRGAAAAAQEKH